MSFVLICYFLKTSLYTASEGAVEGVCSERLRNAFETASEHAPKPFGTRAKAFRNKCPMNAPCFCIHISFIPYLCTLVKLILSMRKLLSE